MKATLKGLASSARDLYDYWSFTRNSANHRFRGVYDSYRAAQAGSPAKGLQGFDHQSVAEYFVDTHFVFNPSDYAILFWLSQILRPGQMLFDFGGGVGQCFYLYQNFLRLPEGFRWLVCDVEALAQRGAQVAQEKKAAVEFTTRFSDAASASVFFTAGALHYIEADLSEMLSELPGLPAHVLINRVPMYEGETYFTVQHSDHSFVPNKVMNMSGFVRGMEDLGYEKVDQWYLPRTLKIPFHPERFVSSYRGFYFRLKADPSPST
jgi:putative methyltransferase (TIGR04325 family)